MEEVTVEEAVGGGRDDDGVDGEEGVGLVVSNEAESRINEVDEFNQKDEGEKVEDEGFEKKV